VDCLPADKPWDVVSVTRRSSGVAPRACVRVYARVLVPPNLYIHIHTCIFGHIPFSRRWNTVRYSGIQRDTARYVRIQLDTAGYSGSAAKWRLDIDRSIQVQGGIHGIPRTRIR